MGALEATFVALVLVAMLTLLFVGWKTPEVVVFLALVLVWNVGTISTEEALSGFNNPGVLAVGSLFVVIKGVEKSRLADKAAKHVFGLRTSFTAGLLRLMATAFAMSAFLNNTPVVALLIPITKDWARTRGFAPSLLLMPLSFACIFGGLVTIIGTSTNLVVQGLVMEAGKEDSNIHGLHFFEPGLIGLPLGAAGMIYLVFAAPRVLPRSDDSPCQDETDRTEELVAQVQVMQNSSSAGQPVAFLLAKLGLPAEALLKIRRKLLGARALTVKPHGSWIPVQSSGSRMSRGDNDSGCSTAVEGTPGSVAIFTTTPRRRPVASNMDGQSCRKRVASSGDSRGDLCAEPTAISPQARHRSSSHRRDHFCEAENGRGPFAALKCALSPPEREQRDPRGWSTGPRCQQPADDTLYVDAEANANSYADLHGPPATAELVQESDTLFLSFSQSSMVAFIGSLVCEEERELRVMGASVKELEAHGPDVFELVLSGSTDFIGRQATGHDGAWLSDRYGCLIIAARSASTAAKGCGNWKEASNAIARAESRCLTSRAGGYVTVAEVDDARGQEQVHEGAGAQASGEGVFTTGTNEQDPPAHEGTRQRMAAGDVVLVLAREDFATKWKDSQDFDLVTRVGTMPSPVTVYDYLSLLVFCGMLLWVLLFGVVMVRAAFVAGGVLMVGGWVDPKKAVAYVDWALLLLVGSALGLSKAIGNSGLASYAGDAIRESGMSASTSLYVLYGFTMVCTELITNNAAAALAVPIALSIAEELEASYKPFVLTVMMAASSSFVTPIGYQTNTMVWAPGGYKFSDFIKLGTPLSMLFLVVGSTIMPRIFPF